ncbi:jg27259 [Pararge aegeria aegeria]|uniref:Jg27259 protein n=1 Tax=Pararge aegeria aegeria TaxID=348720 RepID=A0A8S4RUN3_9NEOP|nr:jg27259 [Pararge aegeria aegeria]
MPAALGLRGCEVVAEFAVSYRHGGASRASAATTRVRTGLTRSSTASVAARQPLSLINPPAPADRRRPFASYFGRP